MMTALSYFRTLPSKGFQSLTERYGPGEAGSPSRRVSGGGAGPVVVSPSPVRGGQRSTSRSRDR